MSSVWSIRRSTADKKLAGVCGGVARHWNVDPVLVRIGWVLLALSGGVGVVLYVAAWLLVPADGAATSTMDDLTKGQTSSWPREAWVAVVAVACLVTFFAFSSASSVSFGPAVVLALIWYFGYYKTRDRRSAPPSQTPPVQAPPSQSAHTQSAPTQSAPTQSTPQALDGPSAEPFRYPGPATPFTQAADAWRQRVDDIRRGDSPQSTPAPNQAAPNQAAPSRAAPSQAGPSRGARATPGPATPAWQTYPYEAGPSPVQDPASPEMAARADFLATPDPVGLYTEEAPAKAAAAPSRRTQAISLSARRLRLVGLIALGVVLLGLAIADSLGAPITPVIYAAAALLVVGLTLIAATWLGRARGILPIGVLLLLIVLAMSVAQPMSHFLHEYTYTSTSQLPTEPVRVDHGLVKVDLSNLQVTSDATFAADLGTGAIEIEAPANTNLVLDYSIGNGMVTDNDTTIASGTRLSDTIPLQESGANKPTLTLDIDVDSGMVAVKR